MRGGGLGIVKLRLFNFALMGKWLWKFLVERKAFWRRVVMGKYGEGDHEWAPGEVRSWCVERYSGRVGSV